LSTRNRRNREAAARHDHVHMRMMRHRRTPSVENGGDADPGAKMLRFGGDTLRGANANSGDCGNSYKAPGTTPSTPHFLPRVHQPRHEWLLRVRDDDTPVRSG
jgi:hypothetical protein